MNAADLVLFDLDGTLVDTAPDIADTVNAVLRSHKLPIVPERWVRDRIGRGTRELFIQAWSSVTGVPETEARASAPLDALLDEFAEAYAGHAGRRGHPYPEARATLAELRAAGVKLALLTNKEQRFVRLLMEVHELDGEFDLQVCGDSLTAKKPDALPVRHCLSMLNVAAARALLVGDSDIDVATARNAGIGIWAVSYGYNGGKPIGQSRPDRIIGRLGEVLEVLPPPRPEDYSPRASSSSLYFRSNPRN